MTTELYRNNMLQQKNNGSGTAQAATRAHQYDTVAMGITQVDDPNGHAWNATWDSAGNLLSETAPRVAGEAQRRTTQRSYDSLNDLTAATDASRVTTTFTYYAVGNLKTDSRPLTGSSQTATTTLTYGDTSHPGDVTQVTDPNNHTTRYAYDVNGDLTSITDGAGDTTPWRTTGSAG